MNTQDLKVQYKFTTPSLNGSDAKLRDALSMLLKENDIYEESESI